MKFYSKFTKTLFLIFFLFGFHNLCYSQDNLNNSMNNSNKSFWKKRLFENTMSTKLEYRKSKFYIEALRESKKKNFLKSRNLINTAIKFDKFNYDYLIMQARNSNNLGLKSKAINQYKRILKIFPEKHIIFFEIGNTYLSSNNPKHAKEYFKKYLKACNFNCNKKELVKNFIK